MIGRCKHTAMIPMRVAAKSYKIRDKTLNENRSTDLQMIELILFKSTPPSCSVSAVSGPNTTLNFSRMSHKKGARISLGSFRTPKSNTIRFLLDGCSIRNAFPLQMSGFSSREAFPGPGWKNKSDWQVILSNDLMIWTETVAVEGGISR
jgi:hypothetical protein